MFPFGFPSCWSLMGILKTHFGARLVHQHAVATVTASLQQQAILPVQKDKRKMLSKCPVTCKLNKHRKRGRWLKWPGIFSSLILILTILHKLGHITFPNMNSFNWEYSFKIRYIIINNYAKTFSQLLKNFWFKFMKSSIYFCEEAHQYSQCWF